MIVFLQESLKFILPLLIVALAGYMSEKSGIVNIALEGTMVFGAFIGVLFLNQNPQLQGQGTLLLAILIAALGGAVFQLLHAAASISMRANQSISGMSLNMLAPAIAIFITKMMLDGAKEIPFTQKFLIGEVSGLSKIPIIGPIFFEQTFLTTFVAIGLYILFLIVINYTKFGLHVRASGEHPHALDAAGVNVKKIRYTSVLISGALAGFGGLLFFIPTSGSSAANVQGYGFLAIAILVFSRWNIGSIFWSALFFGLMKTISVMGSEIPFINNMNIPKEFLNMLPYVATILILALSSSKSKAPSAVGKPYDMTLR